MLNLLASAATPANPKQAAIDAVAPNAAFAPSGTLIWLTVAFFLASAFMVWLMLRAGKGYDYNS